MKHLACKKAADIPARFLNNTACSGLLPERSYSSIPEVFRHMANL